MNSPTICFLLPSKLFVCVPFFSSFLTFPSICLPGSSQFIMKIIIIINIAVLQHILIPEKDAECNEGSWDRVFRQGLTQWETGSWRQCPGKHEAHTSHQHPGVQKAHTELLQLQKCSSTLPISVLPHGNEFAAYSREK